MASRRPRLTGPGGKVGGTSLERRNRREKSVTGLSLIPCAREVVEKASALNKKVFRHLPGKTIIALEGTTARHSKRSLSWKSLSSNPEVCILPERSRAATRSSVEGASRVHVM